MTATATVDAPRQYANQTRVGQEIANPLGFVLARNKRMADQLMDAPEAADAIQKVLRGVDYFCRRHGLHTPEQRKRIHANVIYIEGTDSIVVQLERG